MNLIKRLLGERLRITLASEATTLTWYRLNVIEIFLVFILFIAVFFGVANLLGFDEIGDTRIPEMTKEVLIIYWSIVFLLLIHLAFNRKSKIVIRDDKLIYKKRPITGRRIERRLPTTSEFIMKLKKSYHENDVAFYPDIYTLTLSYPNNDNIYLDEFNKEDCERLKKIFVTS